MLIMGEFERDISKLGLSTDLAKFIQEKWGIEKLHPPQAKAMPSILSGNNTMLCIPTASGKTLVSYIGICQKLLVSDKGTRAIYIVPLKALASEKQQELTELGSALGLKIGLGIGDNRNEVSNIEDCDILVCTSEKLDSLMRQNKGVLRKVSVIVADEFHLLNDSTRGPTMEINLARIRHLVPEAQIITLSATVGNSQELADWLESDLIVSQWRPVSLEYSTLAELNLEPRAIQKSELISETGLNPPRTLIGPKSHIAWPVLDDVIKEHGQLLVFVATRRNSESEAYKLGARMQKKLGKEDPEKLENLKKLSEKLSNMSNSTMGDKLADCVKGGVAFHHAGLRSAQRKIIEDSFKDKLLFCLCATPTLAAGVNLPARRVLVRDLKRYEDGMSRYLPVMEVRQMMGRAGRPRFDKKGEAWLLCKGGDPKEIADQISDMYIHGPVEDINSKLAAEPALRFHLLSSIATGGLNSRKEIGDFFSETFLGYSQPNSYLQENIDNMLQWLVEKRFIRRTSTGNAIETWDDEIPTWVDVATQASGVSFSSKKSREPIEATFGFRKATTYNATEEFQKVESLDSTYSATPMGERVAQLYLDPLSADILIDGLRRAVRRLVRNNLPVTEFGLCHLVTATPDFLNLWAKSSELEFGSDLRQKAALVEDELLIESPIDERSMSFVKSAWCTELWYEEEDLRYIEKKLGVSPGDVYTRTDLMQWLLLAAREILRMDDVFAQEHLGFVADLVGKLDLVRMRVRAGCKEDLLQLVQLRNVGRSRARTLSEMGIRTPKDLSQISSMQLDKLKSKRGWGPVLVNNIMAAVKNQIVSSKKPKSTIDDEPLPGERQD